MQFEWNPRKATINLHMHGVASVDAATLSLEFFRIRIIRGRKSAS